MSNSTIERRPTTDKLIGMTPEEILGIFGGADVKKYGKYIPRYNREREDLARKSFGASKDILNFNLEDLLFGKRQAKSKSGFSEIGSIDTVADRKKENIFSSFDNLKTGFESEVFGLRQDFEKEVYGALGDLAKLEVFDSSNNADTSKSPPPIPTRPLSIGTISSDGKWRWTGSGWEEV